MATMAASPQTQCPIRSSSQSSIAGAPARCPVSNLAIDPRNNMPVENQEPTAGESSNLPTTRVISSIPRPPDSTYGHQSNKNWEYPSPQQFYNALLRKGWDMPADAMETMVLIHNNLNEDAWKLVMQWESRFHGGDTEATKLELASFSGIHGHLSNKARFYKLGKRFFPSYFTLPDPFDRHDWIVCHPRTGKKARYVIDYYGFTNAQRETKFIMDVRPALDGFDNVRMRVVALLSSIFSNVGVTPTGVSP
ncbi:cytochrome c and c1 heme-lyase [Imleria badia]|nr:cytochrome c and c1 heme-lyase [Imleria badia]